MAPAGLTTRPMLGKVREALFNILADQVYEARVADCFSGTGAVGLEALSRGAEHIDFFEAGRHALGPLGRNIAQLGVDACSTLHRSELPGAIGPGPLWDIVVVDQPWTLSLGLPVVERVMACERLSADGVLVISERRGFELDDAPWNGAGLEVTDRRRYGDSSLVFLAKSP
jgi:16S rRNA (guanine966-N2)-methyltransferase